MGQRISQQAENLQKIKESKVSSLLVSSERSPRWQWDRRVPWGTGTACYSQPNPSQLSSSRHLQVPLWSYNSGSWVNAISSCAWGEGQGEKSIREKRKTWKPSKTADPQLWADRAPPQGGFCYSNLHYDHTGRVCSGHTQLWGSDSSAPLVLHRQQQLQGKSQCSAFWCLWITRSPAFESHTQHSQCFNSAAFTWKEPLWRAVQSAQGMAFR